MTLDVRPAVDPATAQVATATTRASTVVARLHAVHEAADRGVGRTVWIHLRPIEDLLAEAGAQQRRADDGERLPLLGVTCAVKDNIDVAGLPTTAAHPPSAVVPAADAPAVARLRAAGAVVVGKVNMDQFATGLVGTRSPHGAVPSASSPDRVAGGSSSGSGAAVGLGLVDVALGTDTAGSGRVPAAFNRVVGLKPTLGLVPSTGVVPACPSYDTVSVLAADLALGCDVLRSLTGVEDGDPSSRPWPAAAPLAARDSPVIAVPTSDDLGTLSPAMRDAFDDALARLEATGAVLRRVDLTPMLEAATLLYGGALVAERAWSFGRALREAPADADPVVAAIAEAAGEVSGVDLVRDQQRLRALTRRARTALLGTDALVVPTAPDHPTPGEVADNPVGRNARLGTFTNFVNLMDMAAVAVPSAVVPGEGEAGITIVVPAFHDQVAADVAARFLDPFGGSRHAPLLGQDGVDVAVFGAHLRGQPLNAQLQDLGARHVEDVTTAPRYRMQLVPGSVERPALVRGSAGDDRFPGASLPGELWRLPRAAVVDLLLSIRSPLGLGDVELDDGRTVLGFIAATDGSQVDITDLGGWRAYRASV